MSLSRLPVVIHVLAIKKILKAKYQVTSIHSISSIFPVMNERAWCIGSVLTLIHWIPKRNQIARVQTFPLSQDRANSVNRQSLVLQSDDTVLDQ